MLGSFAVFLFIRLCLKQKKPGFNLSSPPFYSVFILFLYSLQTFKQYRISQLVFLIFPNLPDMVDEGGYFNFFKGIDVTS